MKVLFNEINKFIVTNEEALGILISDIFNENNNTVDIRKIVSVITTEDAKKMVDDFEVLKLKNTKKNVGLKLGVLETHKLTPKYLRSRFGDYEYIAHRLDQYYVIAGKFAKSVYQMVCWYVKKHLLENGLVKKHNKADITLEILQDTAIKLIDVAYKFDSSKAKWCTYAWYITATNMNVVLRKIGSSKSGLVGRAPKRNDFGEFVWNRSYSSKFASNIDVIHFCDYLIEKGADRRDIEVLKAMMGVNEYENVNRYAIHNGISKERARQLKDRAVSFAASRYREYLRDHEKVTLDHVGYN